MTMITRAGICSWVRSYVATENGLNARILSSLSIEIERCCDGAEMDGWKRLASSKAKGFACSDGRDVL